MKAQVFLFVCLLSLAAEAAVSKGKHKLFIAWQKVTIDQDGRNMFLFLNLTLSLLPQYILVTVLVHELFAKYDFFNVLGFS